VALGSVAVKFVRVEIGGDAFLSFLQGDSNWGGKQLGTTTRSAILKLEVTRSGRGDTRVFSTPMNLPDWQHN
jgi:hypothetical protein